MLGVTASWSRWIRLALCFNTLTLGSLSEGIGSNEALSVDQGSSSKYVFFPGLILGTSCYVKWILIEVMCSPTDLKGWIQLYSARLYPIQIKYRPPTVGFPLGLNEYIRVPWDSEQPGAHWSRQTLQAVIFPHRHAETGEMHVRRFLRDATVKC